MFSVSVQPLLPASPIHATTTAFRLAHTFGRTRDLLVSDYIGKNFSSLVRVL